MLVALLILGIMSALGYGTYRAARISAERTEEALQRSREIEFGMRVVVMDFAQMVPRPVRDPLGQTGCRRCTGFPATARAPAPPARRFGSTLTGFFEHAFNSDPGFQSGFADASAASAIPLAELTRAGWSNTAGQQRGTLQRVSYALVDDVLKRSYTTALDTVQGTKPVSAGPVRPGEDRAVALSGQQPDLAEPVAAGDVCSSRKRCGPGRSRSKSPSSSRTGAGFAG